jgi:S-adenosylmethionine-dependent methyltransferase
MNPYEKQIEAGKEYIPAIEQALLVTYFSDYDQELLDSEAGKVDIENNVFRRYDHSLRHVVPWMSRQIELTGKNVLEIGCGTGSSTAALAPYVRWIEGYDIHSLAIQGARKRMDIMGLDNVRLNLIDEDSLIERITKDTNNKYDIILLFAVLEHQTVVERHDTLKTCWDLLADGGIMAVIDTPNILHYFDLHTSKLPFLHMLPTRLYARYARHSPRSAFAKSFSDEEQRSDTQLDLDISRWGRGASYHDFELALGKDYKNFIVAQGFEPEILDWFVCTIEEEMLRWYVEQKAFDIPLGFTRCVLNIIFKKQPYASSTLDVDRHPAPPLTIFNPDLEKRIQFLEQKILEKDAFLGKVYQSTTWRTGNILAKPYRKIRQFFKE